MLERALDRVSGRVSQLLQQQAARKFPELIDALLVAALERWDQNDWLTFDQSEVNCTAQLYRWLTETKRTDSRFIYVHITLEYINLTPAMLAGEESVKGAQRPDLNLVLDPISVHVECKRLQTAGPWCRLYVHNGIARFVDSSYGARSPLGVMVGYVQQGSAEGLLDSVNSFVATHPSMGDGHELSRPKVEPFGSTHRSHHSRHTDVAIDLAHVWVRLEPSGSTPAPTSQVP